MLSRRLYLILNGCSMVERGLRAKSRQPALLQYANLTIKAKSLLDTESVKFQVHNLLPIARKVRECICKGALSGVSFTGILTVRAS